eukprot:1458149-Rhodomonas_salina.1
MAEVSTIESFQTGFSASASERHGTMITVQASQSFTEPPSVCEGSKGRRRELDLQAALPCW